MKPGTIANCRDYVRLRPLGFDATLEVDHNALRSERLRCHAIACAMTMKPGEGEPAKAFLADSELAAHLPPTAGPSVSDDERARRQLSADKGDSWQKYAPPLRLTAEGDSAAIAEADTKSKLVPLAAGDLDEDGAQELLVGATASGTEGTWADVRLLVLKPRQKEGQTFFALQQVVSP